LGQNCGGKNNYDDLQDEPYENHTYLIVEQKREIDYGESI
jgi:hypothetical protein